MEKIDKTISTVTSIAVDVLRTKLNLTENDIQEFLSHLNEGVRNEYKYIHRG